MSFENLSLGIAVPQTMAYFRQALHTKLYQRLLNRVLERVPMPPFS